MPDKLDGICMQCLHGLPGPQHAVLHIDCSFGYGSQYSEQEDEKNTALNTKHAAGNAAMQRMTSELR